MMPLFFIECLKKLLHQSQVDCPMCNFVTTVENNSINSLPKNYPLMGIVREAVQQGRKSSRGERRDASPTAYLQTCLEHDDYLRSYCLKCQTLVCSSCELYGNHRGHPTKFMNEAALTERTKLKDLKERLMEDAEFRREYALADDEFALIEALVRARAAAKLTQAELARRLGTTQSAIARLEGGRVSPSFTTLRRYAEATGTRLTVGLVRADG